MPGLPGPGHGGPAQPQRLVSSARHFAALLHQCLFRGHRLHLFPAAPLSEGQSPFHRHPDRGPLRGPQPQRHPGVLSRRRYRRPLPGPDSHPGGPGGHRRQPLGPGAGGEFLALPGGLFGLRPEQPALPALPGYPAVQGRPWGCAPAPGPLQCHAHGRHDGGRAPGGRRLLLAGFYRHPETVQRRAAAVDRPHGRGCR